MKTLTLSLLATFCTLLSFGQGLSESSAAYMAQPVTSASPLFLRADRAQFASIEKTTSNRDFNMDAFRESRIDRCERARKLRTTGIIFSAIGGGLLIGGATMIALGIQQSNNYNNSYSYNSYYGTSGYSGPDGTGLIIGGAFCTVFGAAGAGVGIPLAIIGAVKARKYCDRNQKYFDKSSYMELSTKGNGLALNF
jgi:hypothetical protein